MKNGGFRIIKMLFRCNILALAGGKSNTQYPPNKVIIWDDHQSQCIGEFTFRSEVRAVKLRRDRVVVVLEHKIYAYNFMDLKLLHQIETVANHRGLCCLSHQTNTSVLACPGLRHGQVRVEHFGLNTTRIISAHDSQIACLTLTMDGLLLATASTRGTPIRIFNTIDGTKLQENSGLSLDALTGSSTVSNPGSSLSFMKVQNGHSPSFIYQIVPSTSPHSFLQVHFDPANGREMVQQEFIRFLKSETVHK
ncbi:hypothetical protein Leryth_011100 [Lithospermum erythrorhizon]|nr:hypothetical protein Leryth_011100 [Lithospermum erythrorhizon]